VVAAAEEAVFTSVLAAAAAPSAVWVAACQVVVAEEADRLVASPSERLTIVDLGSPESHSPRAHALRTASNNTTASHFRHIAQSLIRVYTLWHGTCEIFMYGVGYRGCASSRCKPGYRSGQRRLHCCFDGFSITGRLSLIALDSG
jgi:hypothetical protein